MRERCEKLLLLVGVGDVGEHVDVAFVRRGNIERRGTEQRVSGFLEDGGAVGHVQPVPTELDGRVRRENSGLLGGGLQLDPRCVTTGSSDVTVMAIFDR